MNTDRIAFQSAGAVPPQFRERNRRQPTGLSNHDAHLVLNALRVAADVYRSDAHTASRTPGHERVEASFLTQAKDCEALADHLAEEVGA